MNPNGQNGNNQNQGSMPNGYQNPNGMPPQNFGPTFSAPQNNPYQQIIQQTQAQLYNYGPQQVAQPMQPMQPAQPMQPTPMMPQPQQAQIPTKKKSHALEIALIIFIFLIGIGAIVGAAYCQSQYSALNEQVSSKTSIAVREAKEAQKEIDDKAYEIRNSSNLKEFTGPTDFGAITFKYPKTWNIYLKNNDDTNPGYEAYFSPEYVPPTNENSIFALKFKIVNQDYNTYIKKYDQKKLSSTSAFSINNLSGTKITGKLDEKQDQPDGTEIAIQVNNYTAIIRTDDYNKYAEEFDAIIADLGSANF